MSNRGMGRPTKISKAVTDRVIEAIKSGATYELAAQYAGISYSTFNNWMLKGEEGHKDFLQFLQQVKEAEGKAAITWLQMIDTAAAESWQAAAWKLERRYPQSYGKQVVEHQGKDGGEILIKVDR